MIKIKFLLLILTSFFVWTSCNTFKMQIVSLESDNIHRNDTVWIKKDSIVSIAYYFYSRNGSSMVFIANKSDKPIFFDKKNSFISIDNLKQNFWVDNSQLDGNLTFKQYKAIGLKTQNPIKGNITKADRIDMIAPNSILAFNPQLQLKTVLFDLSKCQLKTDTTKANWTKDANEKTIIKSINFSKEKSPAQFRYFFTFSKTEDFKDPHYLDFNFWVSDIMEMDARQGAKSSDLESYTEGMYNVAEKTDKDKFHPYKKSWRYYLTDYKIYH